MYSLMCLLDPTAPSVLNDLKHLLKNCPHNHKCSLHQLLIWLLSLTMTNYKNRIYEVMKCTLKPLDTFGTEQKLKVHRFINNLQGLQKVMVKDFEILFHEMLYFMRKH